MPLAYEGHKPCSAIQLLSAEIWYSLGIDDAESIFGQCTKIMNTIVLVPPSKSTQQEKDHFLVNLKGTWTVRINMESYYSHWFSELFSVMLS